MHNRQSGLVGGFAVGEDLRPQYTSAHANRPQCPPGVVRSPKRDRRSCRHWMRIILHASFIGIQIVPYGAEETRTIHPTTYCGRTMRIVSHTFAWAGPTQLRTLDVRQGKMWGFVRIQVVPIWKPFLGGGPAYPPTPAPIGHG